MANPVTGVRLDDDNERKLAEYMDLMNLSKTDIVNTAMRHLTMDAFETNSGNNGNGNGGMLTDVQIDVRKLLNKFIEKTGLSERDALNYIIINFLLTKLQLDEYDITELNRLWGVSNAYQRKIMIAQSRKSAKAKAEAIARQAQMQINQILGKSS